MRQHNQQGDVQIVQAVHVLLGQLRHYGATARQNMNKMPAFQNQQGFPHRAAADLQLVDDAGFLNALTRD